MNYGDNALNTCLSISIPLIKFCFCFNSLFGFKTFPCNRKNIGYYKYHIDKLNIKF